MRFNYGTVHDSGSYQQAIREAKVEYDAWVAEQAALRETRKVFRKHLRDLRGNDDTEL